jgi:sulfate permease, SulP family
VALEFHPFKPRLATTLRSYTREGFAADLGAGLTVGIIALPLAMAFAIAAGLKPEQGLVTSVIAGFLISALGGSNVQIGGPAGAFIVIVYGIVERYGLANLLISTILAGVLLFVLGWFKLGNLVRYIPVSIIMGFTNGIAVLIALSQVKDLLGLPIAKMPADFFEQVSVLARNLGGINFHALGIGLITFGGLFLWPLLAGGKLRLPDKFADDPARPSSSNRAGRAMSRLPGPIVALVTTTLAVVMLQLPVETLGQRFGGIPNALPAFTLPEFSWATVKLLLIPTVTIAMLGAIESLLCARVADNLADLPRHDPNQELMAQGIANIVTPFFGGMPATGTIARTTANVKSGARTPVAGIVHALTILAVMLVAAPLAMHVPLATLAGILMYVAWNMGEWHEFARLKHFKAGYRTIFLGTFLLTVIFDLTVAVEVGLVLACLFFIMRMSQLFRAQWQTDTPPGIAVVQLYGALFFGAVGRIESLGDALPQGTQVMIIDAHRLISLDTSGVDALRQLRRELARRGIDLVFVDVNEQPLSLLTRSGFLAELGASHVHETLAQAYTQWQSLDPSSAPGRSPSL